MLVDNGLEFKYLLIIYEAVATVCMGGYKPLKHEISHVLLHVFSGLLIIIGLKSLSVTPNKAHSQHTCTCTCTVVQKYKIHVQHLQYNTCGNVQCVRAHQTINTCNRITYCSSRPWIAFCSLTFSDPRAVFSSSCSSRRDSASWIIDSSSSFFCAKRLRISSAS